MVTTNAVGVKTRTITIETSQFSTNPTKRWADGGDYWEEDLVVEYPANLDHCDDEDLLDFASNEQMGVRYITSGEPGEPTTYQIEIVTPLALSAVAVLEQLRAIFGDGCWIGIARQPVPLHDMWSGDYSDVLPAEQREDWIGE